MQNRDNRTLLRSPIFSTRIFDKRLGEHAEREGYRQIRQEIEGLGKLMQGLIDVRESKDPTKTAAAIALEYGQKFEKAQDVVKRRVERVSSILANLSEEADRSLIEKSGLYRNTGREAEFREVLRGMTEKQRKDFIKRSIDNGQPEVLSAIMDAPAELSGLNDEFVTNAKEQYIGLHFPEYRQERELVESAAELVELAVDGFRHQSSKIRDPFLEVEADEAKKRADAADAEFKAMTRD